jgi:hypothetical protein
MRKARNCYQFTQICYQARINAAYPELGCSLSECPRCSTRGEDAPEEMEVTACDVQEAILPPALGIDHLDFKAPIASLGVATQGLQTEVPALFGRLLCIEPGCRPRCRQSSGRPNQPSRAWKRAAISSLRSSRIMRRLADAASSSRLFDFHCNFSYPH